MHAQLQKWGNSLGLRIPVKVAKELHLHTGSIVNLEIQEGKLIIETPEYNLNDMLDAITPKNSHGIVFDDSQKGNEEW